MKAYRIWSRCLLLVFCCLLAQVSAQSTRQLCTDALLERVSSETGAAAAVSIGRAQPYSISRTEEGLRGNGSMRVAGQPSTPFTFDCRVNFRFRSVTDLDLRWQRGLGERPSRLGSGLEAGIPSQGQCRFPTLYSDSRFRGDSRTLQRSASDLHDEGFGDEASSLCVPSGWQVILYEDDRYRGDLLQIDGPEQISDLKRDRPNGQNWGDRVSSIEVTRIRTSQSVPGRCGREPMLYSDDRFEGDSLALTRSVENLRSAGFGDRASSICVPQGWVVEVFEDSGYRGDRLRLRGRVVISDLKRDRPQGQDWGDRISSVRVSRGVFR